MAFEIQSYPTTTSTSTNLTNDLLWYDDGSKIYVQPHNFLEFHDLNLDQANSNPFAHFFNPYISLNLKTLKIIPNVFVEDSFGDPNFEAFVPNFDPNYESIIFNVINPNDEAIASDVDPNFKAIVFYIINGLVINILLILNQSQSFVFLTLMKKRWTMWTKGVTKQVNILNFKPKIHLMSGEFFVVLVLKST